MVSQRLKRIVLSNRYLTKLSQIVLKSSISKKYRIVFGKDCFIGATNIYEGCNYLGPESSLVASKIGFASYLARHTNLSRIKIGRYTSIGPDVSLITGKHPTKKFVSAHPSFYSLKTLNGFTHSEEQLFDENVTPIDHEGKYNTIIGNDCWIGAHVKILEGLTIGDGAIVAAGAVVVKNVEPYTVIGGVPAKLIKLRFSQDQIDFLMEFKWWDKGQEWLTKNCSYFSDIDGFMNQFANNAN